MSQMLAKQVVKIIKQEVTCVVSTVDPEGTANSALLYYVFDEQSNTFYFPTRLGTAKATNLAKNDSMAIVIHPATTPYLVQGIGKAKTIDDQEFVIAKIADILAKVSQRQGYGSFDPPVLANAGSSLGVIEFKLDKAKFTDASKLDRAKHFEYSDAVESFDLG